MPVAVGQMGPWLFTLKDQSCWRRHIFSAASDSLDRKNPANAQTTLRIQLPPRLVHEEAILAGLQIHMSAYRIFAAYTRNSWLKYAGMAVAGVAATAELLVNPALLLSMSAVVGAIAITGGNVIPAADEVMKWRARRKEQTDGLHYLV